MDNQTAIDLVTGWRTPKTYEDLVMEIKDNLILLGEQQYSIHFFWVPAHVGIAGNECADHLAGQLEYRQQTSLAQTTQSQDQADNLAALLQPILSRP